MKLTRNLVLSLLLAAVAGMTVWTLLPSSLSRRAGKTPNARFEVGITDRRQAAAAPTVPAVTAPDATGDNSPEIKISTAVANPPKTRPNTSLPFRFVPSSPEADALALKRLHDYSSSRLNPVQRFDVGALVIDLPLAWYEMSYDKLATGVGVEAASEQKGWRYLGRTADGEVVAATLVYYGPNGSLSGSAAITPLGAQIAQALNDLADLLPTPQGRYEARLLSNDGANRHFIWLTARDGSPDLFYEVKPDPEWWIGSVRMYAGVDFIKAYLKKISDLRAQMEQTILRVQMNQTTVSPFSD